MMVNKFAIALALTLLPTTAWAAPVLRFSTTTAGGVVATGNTLGLSKEHGHNGPGTEDGIGTFITLENNTYDDYPLNVANPWFQDTTNDWTINGSEAYLSLPNDVEILYAELVWGGSWLYNTEDVGAFLDDSVLLSSEGDSVLVDPDPATDLTIQDISSSTPTFPINYYMRSADVTDFVQEHSDGFYAAEGIPATQDTAINDLNAAGWSLIVVYRNSLEPIRNLTVFVGGEFVDENTVVDYQVDGFCTPPSGAFEGYAAVTALEGDADRTGDSLTIAETGAGPFVQLSGPNNPANNFFSSQINDYTGALDTAGTFGDSNHNASLGINVIAGRQGWDVTTVPMSSAEGHLDPGQTSAILRTETSDDSYMPTAAGLAIEVNAPDFTGADSGIAPGTLALDETATASISMQNVGLVNAENLVFSAPLPNGLSLVSFSINGNDGDIHGNAVTESDLQMGVDLGDVLVGVSMDIEFVVQAEGEPDNGMNWQIFPGWDYDYVSCVGEPPLTEPYTTPPLTVDFEAPASDGDDSGNEDDGADETGGLDDTGGDADAGAEDDDADAGAEDDMSDDSDGSGGTGIDSAGLSDGNATPSDGCGCRSDNPSPAAAFLLIPVLAFLRRRR